jgi:hypothetical protein
VTDVVPFFLLNLDRTAEGGMWANWYVCQNTQSCLHPLLRTSSPRVHSPVAGIAAPSQTI